MNGKAHATASVIATIPTAVTLSMFGLDVGLCAGLGCLAGIFITPELDQISVSRSEWAIIRRIPVFGWFWLMIWDIYARVIPHRSIFSHLPLLGTAIRLLYLELWDLVLWYARNKPEAVPVTQHQMMLALGAAVGLVVSDTLHWLMDGCPVYLAKRAQWRFTPRLAELIIGVFTMIGGSQ